MNWTNLLASSTDLNSYTSYFVLCICSYGIEVRTINRGAVTIGTETMVAVLRHDEGQEITSFCVCVIASGLVA